MEISKRKRNRAECYDYGQCGAYFVTLCTNEREKLFQVQELSENKMPSASNEIVYRWLNEIPRKYPNIRVDIFVVMPDHVHILLTIQHGIPGGTIVDAMRFFKTMTTNEYIREVKKGRVKPFHQKLWQKSYYDHIIRNQQDYNEVWEYIENNPLKWKMRHGTE